MSAHCFGGKQKSKRFRLEMTVLLGIAVVGLALTLAGKPWAILLCIPAPLWALSVIRVTRVIIRRTFRREESRLERTLTLTDEGIEVSTTLTTAILKWDGISRATVSAGNVNVERDPTTHVAFIPARAFRSDEQRAAFVDEVDSRARYHSKSPSRDGR